MSAIIPCIFGTTKGFEMVELAPLPFKMKDLLVAITHGEVELALEDACIKMLRIKSGNDVYTWIGLYRKAYEMGFSREGGYYGAGVWLSDTTVNARHVLDALEDLCQQIRRLALEDRKFQRMLSAIVPQLVPSQALSALLGSKAPYVKGGISADAKNCAFIAQPQAARDIVNWAQNDALAHNFQSVIIAPASAFPKAGASGNITQYADIPALERALERDYTARIAKLDALAKDWQRKAQSLEAEAGVRNSELQTLKQKNSQLESEATRARLLTKPDGRGRVEDDDSFLSEDLAKLLLTVLAVVSVLGNLALAWLWNSARNDASSTAGRLDVVQSDLDDTGSQLKKAQDELAETKTKLEQTNKQLAETETEIDKLRSTNAPSTPGPDAAEPKDKDKDSNKNSDKNNDKKNDKNNDKNNDKDADTAANKKTAPSEGQSGEPAQATAEEPPPPGPSNVLPELPQEGSIGALNQNIQNASDNLEIAILKHLKAVGSATREDLIQYVDDNHVVFENAKDEVAMALEALINSGDINRPVRKKYSLTATGKKRLKNATQQ